MGTGLLIVAGAVLAAVTAVLAIHRFAGNERNLDHDVAVAIFSLVGVLYAVLLAFVVVEVWQADDNAQSNSQAEASDVSQLYFTARALPQPQRGQLTTLARTYAETVAHQEWPLMARGEVSATAISTAAKMRTTILSFVPKDYRDQIVMSQSLEAINRLVDARRLRTGAANSPIPDVMWVGLIVGAVITLAFTMAFRYQRPIQQVLMVGTVAALLAFTLWLVYEMGHPFSGPTGLGPDAFLEVIDKFQRYS